MLTSGAANAREGQSSCQVAEASARTAAKATDIDFDLGAMAGVGIRAAAERPEEIPSELGEQLRLAP